MKDVIQKANVLIEARPHIQQFRGETIVVKFGGSSMDNAEVVRRILEDIAFMSCVGLRPVIIHGGGKAINAHEAAWPSGHLRQGAAVTTGYHGNRGARAQSGSQPGTGQHFERLWLQGARHSRRGHHHGSQAHAADPDTGNVLDWGLVGAITGGGCRAGRAYLEADITPVITPLGSDASRQIYNINADSAAAGLAEGLRARKLVFLSDVPGLLSDPNDRHSLMSTLHLSEVEDLIERGIIGGGMLPKISGALKALKSGVRKTHIIDAALPHSLLLELFTDKGIGTEIIND